MEDNHNKDNHKEGTTNKDNQHKADHKKNNHNNNFSLILHATEIITIGPEFLFSLLVC